MSNAASILYITYDGLLEPLGQSQVWEYLRRLAGEHRIAIVSFEKPEDLADCGRMGAMRRECERAGVKWIPLRYHKRPTAPATAYDIAAGFIVSLLLTLRYRIRIVHARSYVPSVIALALKRLTGTRFLFDMRGFWADERVDGGLWPAGGKLYRMTKAFERRFLLGADAVVSLTHAAAEAIRSFDYLQRRTVTLEVIPTCADLAFFSPRGTMPGGTPFVLGYLGSVGTWYLFDHAIAAFKALQAVRPDARFLVVNKGGHDQIREALSRQGISPDSAEIVAAPRSEVPALISRMDAAVFFIKPVFSKMASAPTRLGELLGMGVPILTNCGVGDMGRIVLNDGNPVGVVIGEFSAETLEEGVRKLVGLARAEEVRRRCREVAERLFSAEWGSERYSMLYRQLAKEA